MNEWWAVLKNAQLVSPEQVTDSVGDECCAEARAEYRQAVIENARAQEAAGTLGIGMDEVLESIAYHEEMDCDTFKERLIEEIQESDYSGDFLAPILQEWERCEGMKSANPLFSRAVMQNV